LEIERRDVRQANVFAFDDIIAEKYSVLGHLGHGTTSKVQRAVRKSDGLTVALKTLVFDDAELVDVAREEYELLNHLDHPYLTRALDFDFHREQGRAAMAIELFDGTTLDEIVSKAPDGRLPESAVRGLARMLFEVVDYLHQNRIVHRDLKPQNILVSSDLKDLRLIDFNTACNLRDGRALTPTGTKLYAPPEVVLGESPSEGGDVWSAGLCLHLALSGRLPPSRDKWEDYCSNADVSFTGQIQQSCSKADVSFRGQRWAHISRPCKALLRRCLATDKCQRPAPMILLEDPWLKASDDCKSQRNGTSLPPRSGSQRSSHNDIFGSCPAELLRRNTPFSSDSLPLPDLRLAFIGAFSSEAPTMPDSEASVVRSGSDEEGSVCSAVPTDRCSYGSGDDSLPESRLTSSPDVGDLDGFDWIRAVTC
jgi:serine/threonine protein kinase